MNKKWFRKMIVTAALFSLVDGAAVAFADLHDPAQFDWSLYDMPSEEVESSTTVALLRKLLEHPRHLDIIAWGNKEGAFLDEFARRSRVISAVAEREDALTAIAQLFAELDSRVFRTFAVQARTYEGNMDVSPEAMTSLIEIRKWMFMEGLVIWIGRSGYEYVGAQDLLASLMAKYDDRSECMVRTNSRAVLAALAMCGCDAMGSDVVVTGDDIAATRSGLKDAAIACLEEMK